MNTTSKTAYPIEISFSFDIPLFDYNSNFITEFEGSITLMSKENEEVEAGTITVSLIDTEKAYKFGHSISSLIEEEAQLHGINEALFTTYGSYRKRVRKIVGNITNRNVLLIKRIEILPEFRGSNFGLLAMFNAIARLGKDCGLIAINAFPFQFDYGEEGQICVNDKQSYIGLETDYKKACKKLKAHYAKLGFNDTGYDNYMVRRPITHDEQPVCLEAYL